MTFWYKFIACSFSGFDSKKMFDAVYKHHAVMCISILILHINLRLVDLNIYFYDVFFNYKMGSKKGYMERGENFYHGID